MQRLAGDWTGTYTYLEPDVPGPRVVGFRLQVFDGFPWRLYGEVRDDPGMGSDETGIISGWSWGRYVWFRKTMPSFRVAQDPKPIPVSEYVQAQYGERLEREPGPHVLSYRGIVAPDETGITGSWTLVHRRLVLPSKRVIVFSAGRGRWQMQRDA